MRDIKPVIHCLWELWAVFCVLVYISFSVTHDTLHREEWAAIAMIIVSAGLAAYYYADFVVIWREKRNASKRETSDGQTH